MDNMAIGQRLVELCNSGRSTDAVDELYARDIVSIEGAESEALPARIKGIDAIHEKGEWWFANNDVHELKAEGPFVGLAVDHFAVRFTIDLTPKGGERATMTELGLYTTCDGKVVQEQFLFHA